MEGMVILVSNAARLLLRALKKTLNLILTPMLIPFHVFHKVSYSIFFFYSILKYIFLPSNFREQPRERILSKLLNTTKLDEVFYPNIDILQADNYNLTNSVDFNNEFTVDIRLRNIISKYLNQPAISMVVQYICGDATLESYYFPIIKYVSFCLLHPLSVSYTAEWLPVLDTPNFTYKISFNDYDTNEDVFFQTGKTLRNDCYNGFLEEIFKTHSNENFLNLNKPTISLPRTLNLEDTLMLFDLYESENLLEKILSKLLSLFVFRSRL